MVFRPDVLTPQLPLTLETGFPALAFLTRKPITYLELHSPPPVNWMGFHQIGGIEFIPLEGSWRISPSRIMA
jgi:hypothetical protein